LKERIAGLTEIRHPGKRAFVITPALTAKVIDATRRQPKDGSTHWSCRKLAQSLGISKDSVQRIWQRAELKPHRLERYMTSDDPDFERKAADIIGLYLDPPQHAAVFCVDEKTAIQALDRLDPILPMSPGRAERHGFEYCRHGTLSLYAALDVQTGKVLGKTAPRHTSDEFVLTKRKRSLPFWTSTPVYDSISPPPTPLGLTRWRYGSHASNAMSSPAASFSPCAICLAN
jgi:hypothetical protein